MNKKVELCLVAIGNFEFDRLQIVFSSLLHESFRAPQLASRRISLHAQDRGPTRNPQAFGGLGFS